MQKILISACLLGENVRYNAVIKPLIHPILHKWQQEKRLIIQCPEVSGGLSTPREPAEINQTTGEVITINHIDVTPVFIKGANNTLSLCKKHNIKYALLKESSPSCGSSTLYDGTFTQTKISGQGVTTQLLEAHNIHVYSEKTIDVLIDIIATSEL